MSVKVRDVYHWIDQIAPFELAEEWDNVGVLAGCAEQDIDIILCALELNPGVIREAEKVGAKLIVTHHPILFRGRKNLCEDDAEGRMLCELVRGGIALIAAHTNFDNADPGVNNALADMLELRKVRALENGMRIGITDAGDLGSLTALISDKLGGPVRCYGEPERKVSSVAVLGGAGEDFWKEALSAGADVYLTGEVSHHRAWDAYLNGLCVMEGGHAATELPAVSMMAGRLKEIAKNAGCDVCIRISEYQLFR